LINDIGPDTRTNIGKLDLQVDAFGRDKAALIYGAL
jgi:hypothetical protein